MPLLGLDHFQLFDVAMTVGAENVRLIGGLAIHDRQLFQDATGLQLMLNGDDAHCMLGMIISGIVRKVVLKGVVGSGHVDYVYLKMRFERAVYPRDCGSPTAKVAAFN